MAEENDNKSDVATVAIPVEEYNRLKSKDGQIATLESQISTFKTANASLTTELEEAKKNKGKGGVSEEEVEARLRKEYGEKLTSAEQAKADFEKKYKSAVVTDKVLAELQANKMFPWASQYLKQMIEQECDLDEAGNLIIKDQNGNPRWSAKHPDKKMDTLEYIEGFKTRQPEFFESTSKSGVPDGTIKTPAGNASGKAPTWDEIVSMSQAEIAKLDPKVVDDVFKTVTLR